MALFIAFFVYMIPNSVLENTPVNFLIHGFLG